MIFAPAAVVEKTDAAKTWLPVHSKTDSPFGWNQSRCYAGTCVRDPTDGDQ